MKISVSFLFMTVAALLLLIAFIAAFGAFGAITVNHSAGDVADGWAIAQLSAMALGCAGVLTSVVFLINREKK